MPVEVLLAALSFCNRNGHKIVLQMVRKPLHANEVQTDVFTVPCSLYFVNILF